jgi:hypothetical protein
MLSRNIDRINAENDIRAARIGLQVQSGEGFQELIADLQKQMGKVFEYDEARRAMQAKRDVLNSEAIAELNSLGDMGNVYTRRTGT